MLDQNERAIEAFSKAIDLWPENYSLFKRRGALYLCFGKYREAISDFTQSDQSRRLTLRTAATLRNYATCAARLICRLESCARLWTISMKRFASAPM